MTPYEFYELFNEWQDMRPEAAKLNKYSDELKEFVEFCLLNYRPTKDLVITDEIANQILSSGTLL